MSSSFSTSQDPVPEGTDLSDAPLSTPAPASGGVLQPGQPEPADGGTSQASLTSPPPPVLPPLPEHAAGERVVLYAVPPIGTLELPPLEAGGESVTITRFGTEVDGATADRAYAAARAAGFTIREAPATS